ncbi:hypothetical protein UFOVP276_73 [uncultured Caudovirales phage]|uniref:Uncharacterized protein n=1 Tax=uncultured Caudovirales phage TaxID=2100421 RepID=A0A6J5LEE4_9CAUD|nr:hypothetical protein UFOVP127_210 [uncultured Caudovirales phage]CAB4135107.1 hypothetical protein UFOVP276_73 [uncultured Caudovirales phage]
MRSRMALYVSDDDEETKSGSSLDGLGDALDDQINENSKEDKED